MERFIDKLNTISEVDQFPALVVNEKKEIIEAQNPCVTCSITLGKELHAGHMFLLSIAEQIKCVSDSEIPIVIINNNTGPRAAGALVSIANSQGISLTEAGRLMDSGYLDVETVVSSYRARSDKSADLVIAQEILSNGELDIFASVSQKMAKTLEQAGFNTKIVSESTLLSSSLKQTKSLNPHWEGSGFMPYSNGKRTVILQKNGSLTATGSMLTSFESLSEKLNADLILVVDSMPDSGDASFVFSETSQSSKCIQVSGAGIGFGGQIASGSRGEALKISEITREFYFQRPKGNLRNAAIYFTLTRPISVPADAPNLLNSFFDFYDNDSLMNLMITCNDELLQYKGTIVAEINTLKEKIGKSSTASANGINLLRFLPQRSQSLFQKNLSRDISNSKNIEIISNDQSQKFLREFGFTDGRDVLYRNGFRKLALRKNYYFNYLNGLLNSVQNIDSVSMEDFNIISQMLGLCVKRSGLI